MAERRFIGRACAWLMAWALLGAATATRAAGPGQVDYDRDIRPILAENCYACHGPDANARKGDLRLDRKEDALRERSGGSAIVPGDLDASELIQRIVDADPDHHIPPPNSGKALTANQVETLRRWVADGAKWQGHWPFLPPRRPAVPEVTDRPWPRNPIDPVLLARLDRKGLKPSPEADRFALIRRLSLDLTGLPPTIDEVDSFVGDHRPDAYERLVDRLLASTHYGERMAQGWL